MSKYIFARYFGYPMENSGKTFATDKESGQAVYHNVA
jgi:hypothetical protein